MKLVTRAVESRDGVVEFINEYKISKEHIQEITYVDNYYVIFFWI